MKDNALRRLFAMIIALAMLTTPIMAVAEEAAEASEPVIEAEGLEPMVEETEAVVLGGEEEVAVEAEAENIAEEVAAPVEAEKTYADEDYPSEDRELVVTKNSVKTSMNVGDTLNVSLDIAGVYASGTWKSSKTKVAVVEEAENEDGNTITALSPGTAKITVKLSNRKTLTITVTVADPYIATDVDFDESAGSAQMRVGDELDLADFIIMEPEWADPSTLTWKSSKSSVAKVDKYGHVTAKKAGKAKITVTTKKTKKKDTIEIQVVANKLTNMFPKPTKAVVSAMAEGGWTFVPASMEMKSNGNLDCQFYLLNGTSLKTKELHNLNIYLAGEDGEPFAYNNFGTVKAAASKNGYKAFKLSFPSAKVDHEVFLPELGDIFIGFEDVDTVYAIANDKYKSELDFIPLDDWHITDSYVPEPQPQPQNVKVTSITLAPASASLEVAGTTTLTATVLPTNATNKNVSWKSSNVSVATVSNGVVKGLTAGTATITATAADGSGVQGVCTVTVKAAGPAGVKVTKITLDKTTASLEEGKTEKLTATVEPSNATDSKVTWTTSNSSVATVSDGTITAVKAGTATITATAADGSGIKAECAVTVTAPVVKNINLDKEAVEVIVGENVRLYEKDNKTVTWTTPNTEIVSVTQKGIVTALKEGTAKVIASAGSDSATCVVTVVGKNVTGFDALTAPASPFYVGDTHKMELTNIQPTGANIKSITWSSSDETVATVTANDKGAEIKAVKAGSATITATLKDNSKKTVSVTVVNKPVYPKTIVLSATSLSIEAGKTDILSVKELIAEDPSQKVDQMGVKYTSNNTTVASVDQTGTVTANVPGTATIFVESANGGAKASCTVTVTKATVTKAVQQIAFDDSKDYSTTINAKNPLDLSKTIVFTPADATNKGITWTSRNEAIATVDENGVVTGKSVGTVIITAKSKDSDNVASINRTITVNKEEFDVTNVTLAKAKDTDPDFIDIGSANKTMTLKATIEPSNATRKDLIWKTDKPEIATVSDGVVTGVSEGKAIITVLAKDDKTKEEDMKKATFEVTVKNIIHVESVSISGKPADSLNKGDTVILSASVTGEGSQTPTETGVVWSSTDPSVASVENGLVTALKVGQTTITATSKDNDKKFDQCVVKVIERATGIKLDQTGTVDLVEGKTLTLKATVEPTTTTDTVVFSDDGTGFATVDSKTGVVTGKAVGKTVITATAGSKKATVTINVVRAPLAKVTGVKYSLNVDKSVSVEWAKESTGYGDWYWLYCKQGNTEIYKIQTQNLTETIPADKLKSGQVYQITVQATLGKDESHLTGDYEFEEGPVSDAVSLNY